MKMAALLLKITVIWTLFGGELALAQNIDRKDVGFIRQSLNLNAQEIQSAATLIKEAQWRGFSNQANFRPHPEFRSLKNLNPIDATENLEVFRAETAFLVNTNSITSLFQSTSGLDILKQIDGGFDHQTVSASQANGAFQEQLNEEYESALEVMEVRRDRLMNPITDAEFASGTQTLSRQFDLNRGLNWCEGESQCILSRARFEGSWGALLDIIGSLPLDSLIEVPSEVAQYAEVQQILNKDEAAQHPSVQGIQAPAEMLFIVRGFMANALIQFSQIVVSVHPVSADQSAVIIQTTVGMEQNDLDKIDTPLLSARSLLMGQSIYNGDSGFSMGLPRLQESMARQLRQIAR